MSDLDSIVSVTVAAILADNKVSEICENCKYFDTGHCFRFPPTLSLHSVDIDEVDLGYYLSAPEYVSRRVEVLSTDFCGEFKDKK